MVTAEEIGSIAVFAGLPEADRERLARAAADLTYVHSFVTPLIGDLFGGSMNLSSNATMTLEAPPTNFC